MNLYQNIIISPTPTSPYASLPLSLTWSNRLVLSPLMPSELGVVTVGELLPISISPQVDTLGCNIKNYTHQWYIYQTEY